MLVIVFIVVILMVLIVRKAIKSLGECLKADSQFKGPIHDHLSTIVNGLVTLRKYERIDYFRNAFVNDLEKSTNVVFCYYLINRWMGFHLDFVCLLFSFHSRLLRILYIMAAVNRL